MQVVACPLCATTDALVDDVAQFIDGCGRPCDHAATFCFDSGSATDPVRQSWWTFSFATEGVGMVAAMRSSLLQFCSIFREPSIWTLRPRVAGTPGV